MITNALTTSGPIFAFLLNISISLNQHSRKIMIGHYKIQKLNAPKPLYGEFFLKV